MRVYIEKPQDELAERTRAREIRRALDEYGFEYGGNASPDSDPQAWFDVKFPANVPDGAVNQFLTLLGARGVTVQRGDGHALAPAGADAHGIDELIDQKLVDTRMIPVDSLGETVQSWRDSFWVTPADMDAAQEEAAYQKILKEYAPQPDDYFDQVARNSRGNDDPYGARDLDEQLKQFEQSGEATKYHRKTGF